MNAEPAITKPRPFRVHIPDEQLDRLKRKLEDYELPESDIIEDAGWSYGVSLEWVKSLKKYWLEEFDWRKAEASINRFVFCTLPLNYTRAFFQVGQLQSGYRRRQPAFRASEIIASACYSLAYRTRLAWHIPRVRSDH